MYISTEAAKLQMPSSKHEQYKHSQKGNSPEYSSTGETYDFSPKSYSGIAQPFFCDLVHVYLYVYVRENIYKVYNDSIYIYIYNVLTETDIYAKIPCWRYVHTYTHMYMYIYKYI